MSTKVANLHLQLAAERIKEAIEALGAKRGAAKESDPGVACAKIKSAHAALDDAANVLGGAKEQDRGR